MKINAGLWIDHHKAVVVLLKDDAHEVQQILAQKDASADSPGVVRVKNAHTRNDFAAEDKLERKKMAELNKYYDDVIDRVHDAQRILILGPGEAKGELRKRFVSKKLRGHIVEIETADKLTDHQIAQYVQNHFRDHAKQPSK